MTHFVRLLQRRAGHAALVLAAVCIGGARPAAVPTGNIAGTVRDQAGQPVPNAQVNIVGTAFNTLSDSAGAYRIVRVPEGVYSVRAAFIGYRSMEVQQVSVRTGKTTSVDFVLEMTAVQSQEITVVSSTQATRGRTGRARTGTIGGGATRAGATRADRTHAGGARAGGPPANRWGGGSGSGSGSGRGQHRELRGHRGVALPARGR